MSKIVDAVNSTSQSGIWIGAAGDTFRTKIEDLPTNARKCADSYGIARDAAALWAGKIDDTQARADTALAQARAAHEDLAAAQNALSQALAVQASSSRTLSRTQNLYDLYRDMPAPAGVTVPTDWQLRQARNASSGAASRVNAAESTKADAQARLDAAKRLVAEAKSDYDDGARVVVAKLADARDAGVRADTWWESVYHSDAWGVIVAVVTVVVIVAAIVLSGGAALAILAVGGALLFADSYMAWQEGDMSTGEFALAAALTFVPGGKLVGAAEKGLSAATRGVTAATRGGKAADRVAETTASLSREQKQLLRGVDRGDGRDEFGHFATKHESRPWADKEAQGLRDYERHTGVKPRDDQIHVKQDGSDQVRKYDGLAEKPDRTFDGVEIKSGSASKTYNNPNSAQRSFDEKVSYENPARGVLDGRPIEVTSVTVVHVK
ncbi:hypothetical protein [Microbacterium lacticum]